MKLILTGVCFILVDDEQSILTGATNSDESEREYNVGELISFASFDIPSETTAQDPTVESLFNNESFDPFNLYGKSTSDNWGTDQDSLLTLDHYPPATGSTFHVDPFGAVAPPIRQTNSPLNMFSSTFTNSTNNNFFTQSQPQLIPTRILTPTPGITSSQAPTTPKKLTANPMNKKRDPVMDLLDFGDRSPSPPASPTFDPYA